LEKTNYRASPKYLAKKDVIAVRKTFGASSSNIYFLIIKEFLLIALVANVTSHVTVAFTASIWLKRFTDKVSDFGISEYIIPTVISLIVLIITVSFHAIKAARQQPAAVLKRE